MSYAILIYQWVIKRLPRRFSIPLVIFLVLYFLLAFPWLTLQGTPRVQAYVLGKIQGYTVPFEKFVTTDYSVIEGIVGGVVTITLLLAGVVLSWSLAAIVYSVLRGKPIGKLVIHDPSDLPRRPAQVAHNLLSKYDRIGIILAGGGAKGAYQAGAMQAIYEFLKQNQALHKVRMIAGTSIGSWNSMFWLAGYVGRPENGAKSVLQQWWEQVDVKNVIRPSVYVPLRQNYLLSADPWQESFQKLFKQNAKANEILSFHINHPPADSDHNNCSEAMHFYFTRANVATGKLAFTTNRNDLSNVPLNLPRGSRPKQKAPRDTWKPAKTVDDLQDAVFASMDIPPLFKYSAMGDDLFEDGGVIDNLPIRFGTEFEDCDLLFVLPLNASFTQTPNQRSIVRRLFRVLDVRQGVLERNSFKMVYLFNELAALRDSAATTHQALLQIREQIASTSTPDLPNLLREVDNVLAIHEGDPSPEAKRELESAVPENGSAINRALKRKHKMVQVFSICPEPELIINTAEFWKTRESGVAFRRMYEATQTELDKFFAVDRPQPSDWIRMARVSPEGEITYLMDF